MTTAVDKWPAAARLVAVAAAGHLPTAPTPPQGTRPNRAHSRPGDRWFESISLQRGVRCEPDFGGGSPRWRRGFRQGCSFPGSVTSSATIRTGPERSSNS